MRIGWKLVLVGLMLLLLLIPLGLLDSLVAERQARGQEVADEIARSSSGPQQVVGPLLLVEARKLTERRRVVTEGTASLGDVPGYLVAGKTGTAEKTKRGGGYYSDKVINTFAAVFPANDPAYVLVITLDEPVETSGPKPRRTAGWTSVPVAAEVIRRTAPLLGMRPQVELAPPDGLTAVSN